MNENQRKRAFRQFMREKFGTYKYRILRNGEVHAYGRIPNTCKIGWYLFGHYPEVANQHLK